MNLKLLVFTYGPRQRRAEIELHPTIPESVVGKPAKINAWVQGLAMTMAPDFKFTNEWGCSVCGNPAKETKYNVASWVHLPEPRVTFYIYHVCDLGGGLCSRALKQQEAAMAAVAGPGLMPRHSPIPPGMNTDHGDFSSNANYPLASSCAKCNDPKTAKKGFKMSRCGRCKLTRYCSQGCQHADWPRHKTACKAVESVKWVWPDGPSRA